MTDMRGSSDFRLRGGGVGGGGGVGSRTESDRNRLCPLFGPQTYLQWVQRPQLVYRGFKDNCTFWFQRGSNIFQGWGLTHLLLYSL